MSIAEGPKYVPDEGDIQSAEGMMLVATPESLSTYKREKHLDLLKSLGLTGHVYKNVERVEGSDVTNEIYGVLDGKSIFVARSNKPEQFHGSIDGVILSSAEAYHLFCALNTEDLAIDVAEQKKFEADAKERRQREDAEFKFKPSLEKEFVDDLSDRVYKLKTKKNKK